ncbi:sodium- and chloride-dependent GABA transporter 1-like [Nelusetta ayraudi]|uniref:sodium- and chloride-dependent GABA transporter 1-like n=1 Tax=Nelusetta ayraudi TaxID=303726 RepID=UPI003F6F1614
MEEETKRPTWGKQIEFTLAGIGYAVGVGNIWRFPYLCNRSGGGAFLVPYLIMLVFLGMPLLYMELTLGQYLKKGPVQAMAAICPLFKGVGVASVAVSFIVSIYYNLIITWSLFYLFNSFQNPLPWDGCNKTWTTENCTSYATNRSDSTTASQEFFRYRMLGQTSGIEEAGQIQWQLVLILILSWIFIYLCIFKGVKSQGKVIYFTVAFPYVVLIALMINNAMLPGALEGIKYFIIPQWDRLLDVEVWVNAAAQIFNSIGIGYGSFLAMSSYNSFNNNVLRDALTISIVNSLTSIFGGFVVFSAIGYMSFLQSVPISELAVDGPGLVFVVYPQAFVNMPVSQLWSVLFFFMMVCLGVDSEFAMVDVLVTTLMDQFNVNLMKIFKRKEIFVLFICVISFLLGIPCVLQSGVYVFQLMDHYTAIISVILLAFVEVVVVCWLYGVDKLSDHLHEMTGHRPNIAFRLCWKFISPLLILVILVFVIIQFKPAHYENVVFPSWAQGIGWAVAVASIVWIPVCAIHTLWVLPGSLLQKLKLSVTPHALEEMKKGAYNEKMKGLGQSDISVITFHNQPKKATEEAKF